MRLVIKYPAINLIRQLLLLLVSLCLTQHAFAEIKLPKGMMAYVAMEQKETVAGEILANGSSRVGPIVNAVLNDFINFYPQVQFRVEQNGSSAAIEALLEGKANIGLMSRRIKTEEISTFIDRRGYPPTELRIASDALRVIVNRHNPINQLSLAELEAIFSADRLCGAPHSITAWEDFGWVAEPNSAFSSIGRHISAKGTGVRDFIKKVVLCDGEFKAWSIESAHTTADVIQEVALSHSAVGFAALGVQEFGVKDIFITKTRLHPGFKPSTENVMSRRYPLSRYLYIYIDKPPASEMPLLFREFFKFLFSKQGQQIIVNQHAIPLSHRLIRDELTKLINK